MIRSSLGCKLIGSVPPVSTPQSAMASFYIELLSVLVLTVVVAYGSLMSGAPAEVVRDISVIISMMGLGITVANAAARELAHMTVRWGVKTIMRIILL